MPCQPVFEGQTSAARSTVPNKMYNLRSVLEAQEQAKLKKNNIYKYDMDQNHQSRLYYVKNLTQDVSCRNKVSRVRFMHVKINLKIGNMLAK